MSVWRALKKEHDLMWVLMNELTGGSDEPTGSPAHRQAVARQLVAFAAGHELAEEAVIWPAVRRLCAEGDDLVGEALAQESQSKWALNALRSISAGTEEFDQTVHTIAGQFRTHMSYEQTQIWPRLADRLTGAAQEDLLTRWHDARRQAPTRPMPHVPADPRLLGAIIRMNAAVGRAREAFSTR